MSSPTVHDFEQKLRTAHRKVEFSSLSTEDKRLLVEFDRHLVAEGLSIARRWKLLEYVYVFGTRHFSRSFQGAATADIHEAVYRIETSNLAPWTKHDFKVAIRKFFKFVEWGHEALTRPGYPDSVAGVSTRVRKRDRVRVQAADILTEGEAHRLIAATETLQYRALISLTYELGARIGEIGSMNVGDISRDHHSFLCDLNGKTGHRVVRIIGSAAALTAWLNAHPHKNDSTAALWGSRRAGRWKRLAYGTIQRRFKRVQKRAGITKRVHPHLLRHSRITHVLANGEMNEAQAKVFFGLTADSSMLATYAHLLSQDANDAVLRMHGLTPDKPAGDRTKPCGMCATINDGRNAFCSQCGYSMRVDAAESQSHRAEVAGERIMRFLSKPEIASAFRGMIREEVRSALARPPPQLSVRSDGPRREPDPSDPGSD